tara:strand:- start:17059 stop:17577 length:519 start_codon:yes stop_codon:yes gene_type:complete
MDCEPELCPRVPYVGDIWLTADLREFVQILRPVKAIPGLYVIRTLNTRLPGIEFNSLPRLAAPLKDRYTYIGSKNDFLSQQHAANMFKTGQKLSLGDIVVDMNGAHGIVCSGKNLIQWLIPSEHSDIYDLSPPVASQWPITFVCKCTKSRAKLNIGLLQLGYMEHHGRFWRI